MKMIDSKLMRSGFLGVLVFFFLIIVPQAEAFDIFLMGYVTDTHYDRNPATIEMKVIEGALGRTGQIVEVIIPDGEGLRHFKRRIKLGVELDTRVRILDNGKYEMATAQLRGIPSRDFKGSGESIEDRIKQMTKDINEKKETPEK